MYWGKLFLMKYDILVAICDEELLNKKLVDKKVEIKISKEFYGERLIDDEIAIKLMERATIGNLIGEKIISLAEKNGFITKENIILIDGVPHAQFVKLE